MRSCGGGPDQGVDAFMRRGGGDKKSVPLPWEETRARRRSADKDLGSAGILISDFPVFRTERNGSLLSRPLCVWYWGRRGRHTADWHISSEDKSWGWAGTVGLRENASRETRGSSHACELETQRPVADITSAACVCAQHSLRGRGAPVLP